MATTTIEGHLTLALLKKIIRDADPEAKIIIMADKSPPLEARPEDLICEPLQWVGTRFKGRFVDVSCLGYGGMKFGVLVKDIFSVVVTTTELYVINRGTS